MRLAIPRGTLAPVVQLCPSLNPSGSFEGRQELGPGSRLLRLWRACVSCRNPGDCAAASVGRGLVPELAPGPGRPAQPRPAPPSLALSAWTTRPASPALP